jgi:hypothetical protein
MNTTAVSLAKSPIVSLHKRNADGRHKTDVQRRSPGIDTSKRGR